MYGHETLVAISAYGKRLQNQDEVDKHWKDGKDFQLMKSHAPCWWRGGPYFSIRDRQGLLDSGAAAILVVLDSTEHHCAVIPLFKD